MNDYYTITPKRIKCENCYYFVNICCNKNCKNSVLTCYSCNYSRVLDKTSYIYCIKCSK